MNNGLPETVAEMQTWQHERLVADVEALTLAVMEIGMRVHELIPGSIVPEEWEMGLANQMGAAMQRLVSAHVRYSALVSFRIAQTIEQINARDAGGGADEAG